MTEALIEAYQQTCGGVPVKVQDNLDRLFKYRGEFNPIPIRAMLGLDNHPEKKMPPCEIERLANLLNRSEYISPEEIRALGLIPVAASNV